MAEVAGNDVVTVLRRGILKCPPEFVLQTVDGLNLRPNGRVSVVVGAPLRILQQKRDVTHFAATAPVAAVRALSELLGATALQRVIELLGENSDDPSFEQLANAVDQCLAEGVTSGEITAMLSFAIEEQFAAAPHCWRLLDERPDLALPELEEVAARPVAVATHEVDPAIKEQRRQRREVQRQQKKKEQRPLAQRPKKSLAKVAASSTPPVVVPRSTLTTRRRLPLTPAELARFSTEHPQAGWLILADVPFDATDPEIPDVTSKLRPAVVIAGAPNELLVQPVYSKMQPTRMLLSGWRRLGLDRPSYVDGARIAISWNTDESLPRLGQLNDEEWNLLA